MPLRKKKSLVLISILILFTTFLYADVAPEPDEIRLSNPLTVETVGDFSDYRFFVSFYNAVHEIELKPNTTNTIPNMGGGARYSSGLFLAIPAKSIKAYPNKLESPYSGSGQEFSEQINQRKFEGIIELGQHRFSGTLKKTEIDKWENPTYRLERNKEKVLNLVRLVDPKSRVIGLDEEKSNLGFSKFSYVFVVVFTVLAIIILGIWLFRRKGRKLG